MDGLETQLVQTGPAQAASRVTLRGGAVLVGRGADAQLRVDDDQMSRQHFALTRSAAGWSIRDLDSTNGTYVNGQRLVPGQSRPLSPGDRIRAGRCNWTLEQCGPALAQQAAAPRRVAPPPAIVPPAPYPVAPIPNGAQAPVQGQRLPQAIAAWQWIVSAVLGVGLVLVAAGVFLPWFAVEAQLKVENLPGGAIIKGIADVVGQFLGQDGAAANGGLPFVQQAARLEISGADAGAQALLIPVGLVLVLLVMDLALRLGRSGLPGLAYLAAVIVPAGVKFAEIQRVLDKVAPLNSGATSLFGKDLLQLLQGASSVVRVSVTPLAGVYLAGGGLLLLLIGGSARCIAPIVRRNAS